MLKYYLRYKLVFISILVILLLSGTKCYYSVYAFDKKLTVKVNLQLEKNGFLPNCDLITVANRQERIDCHDLFFNDGPFVDTHTLAFDDFSNQIRKEGKIDICLYGGNDGKEKLLKCEAIKNINEDKKRELTFHFTDRGIKAENPSLPLNNSKDSFILSLNFIGKRQLICPSFDLFINHPQLYNNLSTISCNDLFESNSSSLNKTTILKQQIPSGIIRDSEVFEVCLKYTTGRICELGQNPTGHNEESVIFNLAEIE
jgi:hypothetical protein